MRPEPQESAITNTTGLGVTDEALRKVLDDLSAPAMLLSCIHLGTPAERDAILNGPVRPMGLLINEYQGFMSDEDRAAARDLAFDVITAWRDRGCPDPDPVDSALLKTMMDWGVGGSVGDEYVPMMLAELDLDHAPDTAAPVVNGDEFPVVIIGCGMSGIVAAIRLQAAGFRYLIIEKNDGPGGTWWENRYPGARVDIGSHFYSYSFEPSHHWTEYFARQPELLDYFTKVMEKYAIGENVRFGTSVTEAEWDEENATWHVHLDDGTTVDGRALISAVGQLNRPFVPDVPNDFEGPSFHTARWPEDIDLTGKDVVMVGAGATGFQLAPAIAEQVKSLTVIQRSAQWMFPNPGYHDGVGDGVDWALNHLPFYGRWFRFLILFPVCDMGFEVAKVDPAWADQEHSVSELNDITRQIFTDWITSQIGDHPDLIAKVVPSYPPTGKRTLQDNGSWLRTLTRPNVELVRAGVDRLEAGAVVDTDGNEHRADVVIWATGFRANDFLFPMRITGLNGTTLDEAWGTRPSGYLGITVAGFPNLFLMFGPGTNFAGGGSVIFGSECQAGYIEGCLRLTATTGHRSIEPRREVYDDFYRKSQEAIRLTAWASPHIEHNYYKNADGEVHGVSPFRSVDYWKWTRTPDPADFDLR